MGSIFAGTTRTCVIDRPSQEEAVGVIRQIRLDPALSGDLNLHKDEEGVESVKVTLKNDDFKSRSVDKKMLNDPAFMPRIRSGGTSRVQIPDEKPSALEMAGAVAGAVAFAGATGYAAWQLYKRVTQPDDPFFPGNEKRAEMNPKQLRFTQPNIAPNFKNPTLPSVEDAANLIRQRRLDPAVFGELTVHKDKEGVVWCEKNRSLYALRAAGVPSVKVKLKNNDFRSRCQDKKKLNDPDFKPRIRGGTSRDQIPTKRGVGES
ncbi:hypothetical protein KI387_028164, partial [Taxus chinensis]